MALEMWSQIHEELARGKEVPKTPVKNFSKSDQLDPQSSPIPHDSDIPHYLQYAEERLGVKSATDLAVALETHRYGPDILGQVPDDKLEQIGIPMGDVIRLKKGSSKWFYSCDRKRKLEELKNDGPSIPSSSSVCVVGRT